MWNKKEQYGNVIKKALLAIIGVNFIWGLDFIVIEYMMAYVSPAIFTLTRLLIGTALVCIVIGEFGYVYAIGKLSVTMVSIFENVLPLTAVLFSLIIFGTMLSGMQLVGGLVIMASVTVLALKDQGA